MRFDYAYMRNNVKGGNIHFEYLFTLLILSNSIFLYIIICHMSTVSRWSWSWLFVRLFGVLRPTREFFTHMETSPLPVKGCKFWPRHIWPLSSDGSLACHTYCDKGHPFIMVISDTNTWYRAFCRGAVITGFNDLGLSRLGFKLPTFCMRYRRSKPLRHRRG